MLKVVWGIYYCLKFGFDKPTTYKKKPKKSAEGAGLSDWGEREYTYTGLRDEIEN